MSEFKSIHETLQSMADPAKAKILARFFKTGPGEYGEGDRFLGVVVPKIRQVAKAHRGAAKEDVLPLLHSPFHEERLTALLILVEQYRRGDAAGKKAVFDLYLAHTQYINNWDLVDLTAPNIVGEQLYESGGSFLGRLARSTSLWERRIAILATYSFIRRGESRETLRTAKQLLHDREDLIHKAVGWMLREVGKRCSRAEECRFLDQYAAVMPRTMLRYSIEHFPAKLRMHYMALRRKS